MSLLSSTLQTIFALSTAPGIGGIAIIRISGGHAFYALKILTQKKAKSFSRGVHLYPIFDPSDHRLLDQALVLCFKAPNSYNGEDMVELHLHGGLGVAESVLKALGKISGLRLAHQGEFTRRAVQNGKMDIAQAEGVFDLIMAEDSAQQNQALALMGRKLSDKLKNWNQELTSIIAYLSAAIDFSDEEDLSHSIVATANDKLQMIARDMKRILKTGKQGKLIRRGALGVIIGAPNVGKSTLLNQLAQSPIAITSPHAGTTRDILECRIVLDGLVITLADTAGVHSKSDNDIEIDGIRRSHLKAAEGDFRLVVIDEKFLKNHDQTILKRKGDQYDLASLLR
ncbi:MAG: GTPase, partial [Pseudomonadota bacterium]